MSSTPATDAYLAGLPDGADPWVGTEESHLDQAALREHEAVIEGWYKAHHQV